MTHLGYCVTATENRQGKTSGFSCHQGQIQCYPLYSIFLMSVLTLLPYHQESTKFIVPTSVQIHRKGQENSEIIASCIKRVKNIQSNSPHHYHRSFLPRLHAPLSHVFTYWGRHRAEGASGPITALNHTWTTQWLQSQSWRKSPPNSQGEETALKGSQPDEGKEIREGAGKEGGEDEENKLGRVTLWVVCRTPRVGITHALFKVSKGIQVGDIKFGVSDIWALKGRGSIQ